MKLKNTQFRLSGYAACNYGICTLIIFPTLVIMVLLYHSCPLAYGADKRQNTEHGQKNGSQQPRDENDTTKDFFSDKSPILSYKNPEHQKIHYAIKGLSNKVEKPSWLTGALALIGAILGTSASIFIAKRNLVGALDQSVHETRLKAYPKLVQATAGLAVYFPNVLPLGSIRTKDCEAMGRALSTWYFQDGGLLLTEKSRDAYFLLARALTKASRASKQLKVPKFPDDADFLSKEKVDEYRDCLKVHYGLKLDNVTKWEFGTSSQTHGARNKLCIFSEEIRNRSSDFQDYLFLQHLSSRLRTELTNDIRSRKPPV